MKKVTIIGAGISGLAAGAFLAEAGYKVTVVEKNKNAGGMCASMKYKDFMLDLGPHKIYSQIPGMMKYFDDILGEDNLMIKKKNSIRLKGKYFQFPLNPIQLIKNVNIPLILTSVKVSSGFMIQQIGNLFTAVDPLTYERYFVQGFGYEGYKLMFKDYAVKVWDNPTKLSVDIAKKRVPVSNAFDLVKSMLSSKENPDVSAEWFYYPKYGMQQLVDKLVKKIESHNGKIILNTDIKEIVLKYDNTIIQLGYNNKNNKCDILISTIPIEQLATYIGITTPINLKYSPLTLVYFILNKEKALKDNWIFFPEKDFIFNRLSEQKSFSQYTCPQDKTVITAEITDRYLFEQNNKFIAKRVKDDLLKTNLINEKDIIETVILKFDNVYPIYDLQYKNKLNPLIQTINMIGNLYTIGRPGLFNYNNMDHCVDMAKKLSEHIISGEHKDYWITMQPYFDSYRIVD